MKRGSEWLSQGAELLAAAEDKNPQQPPCFDVLIVGSGYGGAVAAARIAEWSREEGREGREGKVGPALSIAVLERGLEYLPGDFPKTLDELTGHVRISGAGGLRGWRDGLFDVRVGDDVSALVANGLGGGSLINAGVAERADAATRADRAWPDPWRGNEAKWDQLYKTAERDLAARRWPTSGVPKEAAMRKLGTRLGCKPSEIRPVALTIQPPKHNDDAASPPLRGCAECGDCFSGCNVGAKRTLGTTYLKRARDAGVAVYTGATVLKLERGSGAWPWQVRWVFSDAKRLPARQTPYRIAARRVVLAAGSFGSTEILLRSSAPGLRFSAQLGAGFSTNGDVIGAMVGLPEAVDPWARDTVAREQRRVGPTITHQLEIAREDRKTPASRLVVQDLTVPAPLGWLFGELLTGLMLPQRWARWDLHPRGPDSPDPAIVDDAPGGSLARSLLLSAFSHDGAAGRLHALPGFDEARHDGNLVVHWPGAGSAACFALADKRLLGATAGTGAFWLRNPLWQAVPDSPLIDQPTKRQLLTVHPLGGCRMAKTMKDGVVDPFGRVFDSGHVDAGGAAGRHGAEWAAREDQRIHEGLYVLDGSIVPTSLGINPLLTITALAEGIVDEWLLDWRPAERGRASLATVVPPLGSWPVKFPTPEAWPVTAPTPATTDLAFKERMYGLLDAPYQSADPRDEQLRLSLKFEFVEVQDVPTFLRQPDKTLGFDAEIELVCSWWDEARQRQTDRRDQGPIKVCGHVNWFAQQPTCVAPRMWRTLRAWYQLRRAADMPHTGFNGQRPPENRRETLRKVWPFLKMLSHFGAPRLLAYTFEPLEQALTVTTRAGHGFTLPKGTVLGGAKSLVYERHANPWVQLTEMTLNWAPPGQAGQPLAGLRFDEVFMLGRDELPLMLTRQHDGVSGLRDALSLALYAGRVIFQQHFLSFRKPEYAPHRALRRLPSADARYPALEFCPFHNVRHPKAGGDIRLRLTRIRQKSPPAGGHGRPVLLLHGFGSGGIQFTHEAIPVPMAQWLAEQGREVWVGELRTSIGLPSCEQQWVMDDIAREDVPALVDAVRALRKSDDKIDIVAHCIGSAMFCMAALDGLLRDKIERAVLMQVGPIIHLPRGNRMRGYLGNRIQKLFSAGLAKATVNDDASDLETALDRVLGTFPLLGGEGPTRLHKRLHERQRASDPTLALSGDLRHNARLVNAKRSAGVFAQLFQWNNVYAANQPIADQPLLDALPDLLGACNLTTYQQTVQYAFLRRLTNQDGESSFVTDDKVRANFSFPILFVQGMLNDVFAPRGTHESQRLLQRIFPDHKQPERMEVPGFGHLDCVVGLDARTAVFEKMLPFLQQEQQQQQVQLAPSLERGQAEFRAPLVGPWIGDAQWDGDVLRLQLGLKADEQRMPPLHIYTVLVVDGEPDAASLTAHCTVAGAAARASPALAGIPIVHVAASWAEGEAVLQVDAAAGVHRRTGAFAVWVCTVDGISAGKTAAEFVAQWKAARLERPSQAPRADAEIPTDHVLIDSAWLAASRDAGDIGFALMACRQAPLLVDRRIADRTFECLANKLDGIHHVLMVGDQVYSDSVAGSDGVDGTRLRFFDAHREAWTAQHQQGVMCRRPVYMAADDHEFRDDSNNITRAKHPGEWRAAQDAMWRYQYAAGPRGNGHAQDPNGKFWYSMRTAGFDTFVCDTRNQRVECVHVDRRDAHILCDEQFAAIEAWLARSRSSRRPRFLVVPTPMAPVFAHSVQRPEYALRCDDWQRFPQSLAKLFALLVDDGAEQLVLLSGDYHCFADCDVRVRETGAGGRSITFRSITAPGVHSPYPFANTDREELWEPTADGSPLICKQFRWSYDIRCFASGSGYARIQTHGNAPVTAEFVASA